MSSNTKEDVLSENEDNVETSESGVTRQSVVEEKTLEEDKIVSSGSEESDSKVEVSDILSETIERVVQSVESIAISDDTKVQLAEEEKAENAEKENPPNGNTENVVQELVIDKKQVYQLKWIEWHNKKTPIVTQNENGPCPLIAIANILLLRGKINVQAPVEFINAEDLIVYIGDAIMESIPKNLRGASLLNYEQNMHDAIAILPQLHTGLDVNIKFTGVRHFEYTPECIIFDLLNIPLYHGWLVDPQCEETVNALGNLGYNQLVERIILNKCSSDADLVTEALIAEMFLERTASQLTYHGLCELNSAMKQEELAVLFRNNHFSTILKKKHELFQLVTDQGFLNEPRVIWETLCNIEGDGQFVDSRFATVPPKASECFMPSAMTEEQQINQDYLVALSLQEEQKEQDREQLRRNYRGSQRNTPEFSDEELARRMQEEQQVQQIPGRAPSPSSTSGRLPPSPGGERGKKGAVCNVI